jgi:hypothetical protein
MDTAAEAPLTISREDLYELAWSKPLSELAKDFGISDVGLAKRCRKLGIPIPGRGYWARVDAGQKPYQPKLPARDAEYQDHRALVVAPSPGAFGHPRDASRSDQDITRTQEEEAISTRIAALALTPCTSATEWLAPVKRTAVGLKYRGISKLKLVGSDARGPVIDMQVTDHVFDRALRLADTILRAAETLGWEFGDAKTLYQRQGRTPIDDARWPNSYAAPEGPEVDFGRLLVEGEQIALRIEERRRDEARVPTAWELAKERREYGYHAPRKVSVATGALRVVRLDTFHVCGTPDRLTYYDRKGKPVEAQIPDILLGFHQLALSVKNRRAEHQRELREKEEEKRREKEREEIREANQRLIEQLETDAGAWHRAQYLRRYVRAARRTLGHQILPARFRDRTVDFFDWAERYIDEMDPLKDADRTDAFEASSTGYMHNDLERIKEAFGRLLGSDWSDAWKIGGYYAPMSRSDYGYDDRSIFDVTPSTRDDDLDD